MFIYLMHLFNYLIQSLINVTKIILKVNNNDIASFCNFYSYITKYEVTSNSKDCFVKNLLYSFISTSETTSLTPVFKYNYLRFIIFNDFFNKETKEVFLEKFMKVQKNYFIIMRTIRNYRYRKAKTQITTDIYLNPININDKNVFVLFQNNKKYLFTITDLVNLINSAIGHTDYFFSSPLICKNPYNNIPFNKSDFYNIYFFMKSTSIIMPILFHNYFLCNFSLSKFKLENEDNIREYAIMKYINTSDETVLRAKILNMIRCNYYTDNIKIHNDFPSKSLIKIMKPYLNLYLHSIYSTESNKKIMYEHLLDVAMKQFVKYNPRFGRKIIVESKLNTSKNKKYINKINDTHIPYNNRYDNDFMNNHLTLIDEFNDTEEENEEEEDNGTFYTSDEEIIGNVFIRRETIVGTYNFEDIMY